MCFLLLFFLGWDTYFNSKLIDYIFNIFDKQITLQNFRPNLNDWNVFVFLSLSKKAFRLYLSCHFIMLIPLLKLSNSTSIAVFSNHAWVFREANWRVEKGLRKSVFSCREENQSTFHFNRKYMGQMNLWILQDAFYSTN